jgi:superfamily II DNA/RNA helicase
VPVILEGKDVVLAAETGSGKTLAYLTPIATALLDHASAFDAEDRM